MQIQAGQIDHTPALLVIDPQGRERTIYLTQMNYASISQAAQVLADEAASLLPGHPGVASQRSLAHIGGADTTGRLAAGFGVQDQPWFALVSASGTIVWKHDGWLPVAALKAAARRA